MIKEAVQRIIKDSKRGDLIKAQPQGAYEALVAKLTDLLRRTTDEAFKDLYTKTLEALKVTQTPNEAYKIIRNYVDNMPDEIRAKLMPEVYAITRDIYRVGFSLVAVENRGLNIAFNLKDIDSINIISKNNLYWVGNHFTDEVKGKVNGMLTDMFSRGMTVRELAQRIADELKPIIEEEQRYWEGFADHIAVKTKELGRIAGYDRAKIKYVKVKAILDERTSEICRQMHGRIISVERLARQREKILQARTKDELKEAQSWIPSFSGKTSGLPDGVAGPPYHYRCRTTTVAHFEELEGEPVSEEVYQYFDGSSARKEKVIYRYVDKELGREMVLTEGSVKYASKHLPEEKIRAAMRSIKEVGESKEHRGQITAKAQNGVVLVFRDNVVYNAFIPKKRNYFNNTTIGRFKKWAERLRLWFTAKS